MASLFKVVISVILEVKVDFLFMAELLLIKIFPEHILVLDCYQWQIVEEIPIPLNSLLHSKHALIWMVNMLYLDK
jgi:hypothetical protein